MAKDVAEALGYKNTSKAVKDNCKGNDSLSIGRGSAARLINEADLYRLVMRSNPPSAKHSKAGSVKPLSLQSAKTVLT